MGFVDGRASRDKEIKRLRCGYIKLRALIARELKSCPLTFEPDLDDILAIIDKAQGVNKIARKK
jgi:hypothetical protein